jgi:hypothetical protein
MMRRAPYIAAVFVGSLSVAVPSAAFALGDKVEAGSCAIASSGGASNNSITCNFGLTDAQLKQATEAAVKGATEAQQEHIDRISETLGVTKNAAKTLLKIVGEDPDTPDDKLAEALTKIAGDFKRLQARAAALNPENPTARALVEQAKPEIDAGHFARARTAAPGDPGPDRRGAGGAHPQGTSAGGRRRADARRGEFDRGGRRRRADRAPLFAGGRAVRSGRRLCAERTCERARRVFATPGRRP